MAILEIKKFNDPILRKKCEKVKRVSKEIKKLINDMMQTVLKNDGLGLAAPQVGINKRIIVVKPKLDKSGVFVIINPKITKKSPRIELGEEGCLSFPGLFLKIKRPKKVVVEGLNKDGKKLKIEAEGLLSRVFQHEIDHLDGILFFDRLSFWQRLKFTPKSHGTN